MLSIPYEAQESPSGCGAAALAMVYRSLGLACSQAELGPALVRRHRARTHLLARDALARGLQAVIVQAQAPWECLSECVRGSVRVIVNHRLEATARSGHYSVLVDIDDEQVLLHDPLAGPLRRLSRDEFLTLWAPARHASEVVGHILVAIGNDEEAVCPHCRASLPRACVCSWCGKALSPRPAAALGCGEEGCPGRRWRCLHCPWCDLRTTRLTTDPPGRRSCPTSMPTWRD